MFFIVHERLLPFLAISQFIFSFVASIKGAIGRGLVVVVVVWFRFRYLLFFLADVQEGTTCCLFFSQDEPWLSLLVMINAFQQFVIPPFYQSQNLVQTFPKLIEATFEGERRQSEFSEKSFWRIFWYLRIGSDGWLPQCLVLRILTFLSTGNSYKTSL